MEKRILLIEDETSIRSMYEDILAEDGYDVVGIGDGLEGLQAVLTGNWDLLLLDIMLPKLDGIELLKKVQTNPQMQGKPIVVLTNLEDERIKQTCLSLGVKEFLVKSNIVPGDVVLTVKKYVFNS